jgi:hypothetical protein
MRMLSQHAIDRYRAIFGQGFSGDHSLHRPGSSSSASRWLTWTSSSTTSSRHLPVHPISMASTPASAVSSGRASRR